MKNVWSLIGKASFLFGFCVFYSCKGKEDNTAILQEINDGLVQSNKQIRLSTSDLLHRLEQKVEDPKTVFKAKQIQPKALVIHALTDSLVAYIDSLNSMITVKVGLKQNIKQKEIKSEDEVVRSFFVEQNGVASLLTRLNHYKQMVMGTDDRIKQEIPELIVLVNKKADSTNGSETVLKRIFKNSSEIEALAYLNRIKNNILIDEKHLISFLDAQIGSYSDGYDFFNAIVGQNAKILEAGQTLEITAGAGKFTVRNLVSVLISNQKQLINERGVAIYKIKTPKKPGTYHIPVQVIYTDQDGQNQTIKMTVEYKTVSANLK